MLPMPAPLLSLFLLAPAAEGWLGIYLASDRDEAVVGEVIPDSPAAKAGLQMGDVLLAVGEKGTPTRDDFVAAIRAAKVGDRLSIKVRRGGQDQLVVVKLGQRPDQPTPPSAAVTPPAAERPQAPVPAAETPPPSSRSSGGYLGVGVHEGENRVMIDRVLPESPAAQAGLRTGDVIVSFGEIRVRTLADLDGALQRTPAGRQVPITLHGEAGNRTVQVTLGERSVGATAAQKPPSPGGDGKPLVVGAEAGKPGKAEADVESELAALRAELAELRRQLEALRQGKGRE